MDHTLPDPEKVFQRKIRKGAAVLLIERLWPRLWPPVGVLCVFAILSLGGLWLSLPYIVHVALLALFAAAFFVSLFPIIRVRWPTRDDVLKRLERKAGIPHQPARSYYDRLPDDETAKSTHRLWHAHRQRMGRLLAKMTPGWPKPRADRYDPFALRVFLVLLLPVAYLWAGDSARERLLSAFMLPDQLASLALRLDAWVTPPLYTSRPPILLADGARAAKLDPTDVKLTDVPEKSLLIIRMNGTKGETLSVISKNYGGEGKTEQKSPTTEEDNLLEYRFTIEEPTTVDVRRSGQSIFSWNFNVTPDEAPKISLTDQLRKSFRGALQLKYEVEDDYGVVEAKARFDRPQAPGASDDVADASQAAPKASKLNAKKKDDDWGPLGEPPVFALTLPHAHTKKANGKTIKDLTSHPWAGLDVILTLSASDQAGQTTKTKPIKLRLPEREFKKPLARAVIEQRRKLVAQPKKAQKSVSLALNALTYAPEHFIEDRNVYLGLRSAYWRLQHEQTKAGVESVVDQLWEVARRIEDGDLSDAERNLKLAKERLERALREGASEEEIKKLVEELRHAVNKFLDALQQQAKNQAAKNMRNDFSENNLVSPKDLDQLLKDIEKMAKSGSKEMAQKLLSELDQMMQNLQAGQQNQNPLTQNMMNKLNELSELAKKQQKLLDQTFERRRLEEAQRDGRRLQQRRQGQPRLDQERRGQQRQGQQRQGRQGQQGLRQGQQPRVELFQFGPNGRGPGIDPQQQPGTQPGQGQQQGQQFGQRQEGGLQSPDLDGERSRAGLSKRQSELRDMLGEMLEDLNSLGADVPKALREAESAMGRARDSIQDGNLAEATRQQSLALDRLRNGAQSMAQQLMQAIAREGGRRGQRDPLGRRPRESQGPDFGTSVEVPDEIDIQRARRILEALRERLSDPNRPLIERDYIERLLRRF